MGFYQKKETDVLTHFQTDVENGLTKAQAVERQKKYGKNELTGGKQKSVFQIFLEQFKDFLVIILIIAALISTFTGDLESFIVIMAVLIMNAILGTVQTVKAENSLKELKNMSSPNAKVIRGGEMLVISSNEVTLGDIVWLEAGDQIPADGRILESASLQTNESALTGESTNVSKFIEAIPNEVPLAERNNMAFSGTFVTYGRGSFIVTEIGMNTEVGKIATLIQNAEERETPLQRSLDQFGKKLSIGILIICVLVFGLSLWQSEVKNLDAVMDSLMFAIALAVAAIPEALSSIVTIVLSFGTRKMSKEHAIMRKLQAVEGLGSVSVICSDKTGTLTQNKMVVRRIVTENGVIKRKEINPAGKLEHDLIIASVLCSDATLENGGMGDPTEIAFVQLAEDLSMNPDLIRVTCPRISEVPFDSDRKLMSTLNRVGKQTIMFTKGAADVLAQRMLISQEEKKQLAQHVRELSEKGLRVLCFAKKNFAGEKITEADEYDLEYMGLIAEMDPPREESALAVYECRNAGIKPVMITGDHVVTASAIAKEIGILKHENEAVEGKELDQYSDEQLIEFVADKSVYARVTPEHKIRIVRAWQRRGNIVAMTGDGVNDAPALKQADVGVAMGITGTEVAKDAAAMVLTDDNFATIVKAIKNGRNIYENVKKSILFLLSGNLAGIIAVLFNSLTALPVPFAAIHLLFINLLTDSLPAIALGLEPHTDEVMKQKPRRSDESILTKNFLIQIGYSGLCISIATIAAFMTGYLYHGNHDSAIAMTMAFTTLCMARLFHGFSCKSEKPVLFTKSMFNNGFGLLAFGAGMVLINLVLWVPGLHGIFKIADNMPGILLGSIYLYAFGSMVLIQIIKAFVWLVRKASKNKN